MVYVFSLAGIESGGPELLHQLVFVLNLIGIEAKMVYLPDTLPVMISDAKPIEAYSIYGVTTEKELSVIDREENIVVLPEVNYDFFANIKHAFKVAWWLSVDGYIKDVKDMYGFSESQMSDINNLDYYDFRHRSDVLHLAQSYYAVDFLKNRLGVSSDNIDYLSDYINDIYFTNEGSVPSVARKDMALFNPKKGGKRLQKLIDGTKDEIFWFPLQGMTREKMRAAMQLAKVYVDVGEHPGKDRIPRETAISGCCVITGRRGAAAYHDDVPIPERYKVDDSDDIDVDEVRTLIMDIFENFDERTKEFDDYRQMIRGEKERFVSDVIRIFK